MCFHSNYFLFYFSKFIDVKILKTNLKIEVSSFAFGNNMETIIVVKVGFMKHWEKKSKHHCCDVSKCEIQLHFHFN
jgi:hypothetical protein